MFKIVIKYGHIEATPRRVDMVGPPVGVLIVEPVR
jgi:hypothetical protein